MDSQETKPTTSIIIPYFNEWILTHKRLMELHQYAPDCCEIILVDDASTEAEPGNGINWWMKATFTRNKIRYFRNKENLGFGGSLNIGVKLAHGKYVILLSNDVVMYSDIISDITNLIGDDDKMLVGGRIVDWAGGWNEFEIDGKTYIMPYAEGWLLGCTKAAWKGLGGFDPAYGKFDYEDMDLTARAITLGYNIVGLNSNKVQHLSGQTIAHLNVDRLSITKSNRNIFISKWYDQIPTIGKIK